MIKTFLSRTCFRYIGDFMVKVDGLLIVVATIVVFLILLNPNDIRSDFNRIILLIAGIFILLLGTMGTSKYKKSGMTGGSLIAIIISVIMILYGLRFLYVP